MVTTLIIAILAAANLAAAVALLLTFWQACRNVERSWDEPSPDYSDQEAFAKYLRSLHARECRRMRSALGMIVGAYPVGMVLGAFTSLWLSDPVRTGYVMLVTVLMLTLALRAQIHNDRKWKHDMQRRFPGFHC